MINRLVRSNRSCECSIGDAVAGKLYRLPPGHNSVAVIKVVDLNASEYTVVWIEHCGTRVGSIPKALDVHDLTLTPLADGEKVILEE